jgi:hypothetical protein
MSIDHNQTRIVEIVHVKLMHHANSLSLPFRFIWMIKDAAYHIVADDNNHRFAESQLFY